MKILVFSDSHGKEEAMQKVIFQHHLNTDIVLYAGDGVEDINNIKNDFPNIQFYIVGGNYEDYSLLRHTVEFEQIFSIDKFKVLLSHGHRYGVKTSLHSIYKYAIKKDIDIIVYGHSHIANNQIINDNRDKPLYILNPGSIGSSNPTYGKITIDKDNITTEIVNA